MMGWVRRSVLLAALAGAGCASVSGLSDYRYASCGAGCDDASLRDATGGTDAASDDASGDGTPSEDASGDAPLAMEDGGACDGATCEDAAAPESGSWQCAK